MKYDTIREATEAWVSGMNAIPRGMIAKLMSQSPNEWAEITMPYVNDRVYVYNENADGKIIKINNNTYIIQLDSGNIVECEIDDFVVNRCDLLPMWGTMWSFGDGIDDYWLKEEDGVKAMSECGFRVYMSEEFGYFFGIDGAGDDYDFYEAHWIPLYKARGYNGTKRTKQKGAKIND